MKNKLKIVYIGNRGHSSEVFDSIRGDERFTAVGVAIGDNTEDIDAFYECLKKDYPKIVKYDDYKQMLEIIHPDVAVVSPRFDLTASICTVCAKLGINIIAEKPVALEIEELNALQKEIEHSKIHFMAMHFLRFRDEFYQAINAVNNNEIGDVRLINAQKSYKLGQRDEFYKNKKTYGGTIPWVGIHGIDWIYSVTKNKFLSVYATQSSIGNNNHGDLENSCLCHFVLENDVFASLSIDYLRPQSAFSHGDDRLRVVGTKGVIEVINGQTTLINDDGVKCFEHKNNKNIVVEFLEEIMGISKCELKKDDIFNITRISLIARDSAQIGKILPIEL